MPAVRHGAAAAIDRTELVADVVRRRRRPGGQPDPAVVVGVRRRPQHAAHGATWRAAAARGRRLEEGRRRLAPAGLEEPSARSSSRPDARRTRCVFAAAPVAADWTASGSRSTVVEAAARELARGRPPDRQVPGGRRRHRRSASTRICTRCSASSQAGPAARTCRAPGRRCSTSCSIAARAARHAARRRRRRVRSPPEAARRRARTCSRSPSATRSWWSRHGSSDRPSASVGDRSDRYWDVLTWRLADGR